MPKGTTVIQNCFMIMWRFILTLKLLVDFLENNVFYGNCTGERPPPFFYTSTFYCMSFLHHKPFTPHVCLPFAAHNFHTQKFLHQGFLFYTTHFCAMFIHQYFLARSFCTKNILQPMVPQQCGIAIYSYIQASDMQIMHRWLLWSPL